MQKEAIHFLTIDGFVAYSRHFDQMFTQFVNKHILNCLWQIFCRLFAANKYLDSQIFSPTNDVQDRIFEYEKYL